MTFVILTTKKRESTSFNRPSFVKAFSGQQKLTVELKKKLQSIARINLPELPSSRKPISPSSTKRTSKRTATDSWSPAKREPVSYAKMAEELERVRTEEWVPKKHHKLGVRFLISQACGGLFADPGMGKTSISLAAIKILKQQKMLRRVLIVAPLRPCYLVWPKERYKWTDFHGLKMEILHGPQKDKAVHRKADIYVINPDGLPWLTKNHLDFFLDVDTLIIDESTKFKHPKTKRFKLLKPFLARFARRWILTGTPTPNGYLDLFGQMYILDLGAALGAFITHYRLNYFFPAGYGGFEWKLKPEMLVEPRSYAPTDDERGKLVSAEKAIQHRIAPYTLRLECDPKDMPERVENIIRVELPDDARRIYDELEEEMFTLLAGGQEVRARNAAAATVKCRQVANGGIFYRDVENTLDGLQVPVGPRKWTNLHAEKVDAVGDLYDQLQGSPLMVAYDFEHDLDRLLKAFPKAEVMGGGTSMKASLRIESAWNAGKIGLMLVHPKAMGHGLNLQSGPGHTIALHSLMWDYEEYDQLIRRVWRTGQKSKHVFIHHIVARNTVDESVLHALRSKRKGQDALLQALKEYAASRRVETRDTQRIQRIRNHN